MPTDAAIGSKAIKEQRSNSGARSQTLRIIADKMVVRRRWGGVCESNGSQLTAGHRLHFQNANFLVLRKSFIKSIPSVSNEEELIRCDQSMAEHAGLDGKIKLAQETHLPSAKAAMEPDSPQNLTMFRAAAQRLTGKVPPNF